MDGIVKLDAVCASAYGLSLPMEIAVLAVDLSESFAEELGFNDIYEN